MGVRIGYHSLVKKVSVAYGRFLGYEKDEDGNMRMVEREARIVRQIYSMFLDGQTPSSIAAYLIRCGIPTPAVAGK